MMLIVLKFDFLTYFTYYNRLCYLQKLIFSNAKICIAIAIADELFLYLKFLYFNFQNE